jgi:hypothetical protein
MAELGTCPHDVEDIVAFAAAEQDDNRVMLALVLLA